jgi:hypothetical protein
MLNVNLTEGVELVSSIVGVFCNAKHYWEKEVIVIKIIPRLKTEKSYNTGGKIRSYKELRT